MLKRCTFLVLAAALTLTLSGCTIFRWGGSEKPAPPPPSPSPQAEDVFKKGEDLLNKGKYEEARQTYSSLKQYDPEKSYEPLVQIRLGDSYYEEGRYEEATVEYRRFLEMRPHNKAAPYVKYQLGMCNFKQIGRSDRDPQYAENAMNNFSELLRDYPNNPYEDEAKEKLRIARGKVAEHEFVVGRYYFKQRSYQAAVIRFKGIIESYPGSKDEPETLYYLADSYIRLGNYEAAKNTLAILYKEHPNNKMAEEAKGLAEKIPAEGK